MVQKRCSARLNTKHERNKTMSDYSIIITEEQRELVNSGTFETALNDALKAYDVTFDPSLGTISKMIKASPKYKAFAKDPLTQAAKEREFVNEIKSVLKNYKVGEYMLIYAAANRYWARLNGVVQDKKNPGASLKQVNISMMRSDVAGSKLDGEVHTRTELARLQAENARLRKTIDLNKDQIKITTEPVGAKSE
jgi:hypothetical protein